MSGILRISEAAVLAIHTAALLAGSEGRVMTNGEMAQFLGVSEAHLSKVLQRLGRRGIVASIRGPRGGFTLGRPADEITLLEVYEAVDGPLREARCLLDAPVCGGRCLMGEVLAKVNSIVRGHLSGTRVSDVRISPEREEANAEENNQD